MGALVWREFVEAREVALAFDVLVDVDGAAKGEFNELALFLNRRARRHEVDDEVLFRLGVFNNVMQVIKVFA